MKKELRIMKDKGKKGFTLIELLIVIAIIGVLASLLMSNFIGVRQRARDATRKSDLRQIQAALELYRADAGTYPTSTSLGTSILNGTTVYMTKVPVDPVDNAPYTFSSNPNGYTIIACLENSSDAQKDATNSAPCTTASRYSFTLTNP